MRIKWRTLWWQLFSQVYLTIISHECFYIELKNNINPRAIRHVNTHAFISVLQKSKIKALWLSVWLIDRFAYPAALTCDFLIGGTSDSVTLLFFWLLAVCNNAKASSDAIQEWMGHLYFKHLNTILSFGRFLISLKNYFSRSGGGERAHLARTLIHMNGLCWACMLKWGRDDGMNKKQLKYERRWWVLSWLGKNPSDGSSYCRERRKVGLRLVGPKPKGICRLGFE